MCWYYQLFEICISVIGYTVNCHSYSICNWTHSWMDNGCMHKHWIQHCRAVHCPAPNQRWYLCMNWLEHVMWPTAFGIEMNILPFHKLTDGYVSCFRVSRSGGSIQVYLWEMGCGEVNVLHTSFSHTVLELQHVLQPQPTFFPSPPPSLPSSPPCIPSHSPFSSLPSPLTQ